MKRESRTVDRAHQVDSPTQRHLPLVDLLVDTRAELMELAVASGLKVLHHDARSGSNGGLRPAVRAPVRFLGRCHGPERWPVVKSCSGDVRCRFAGRGFVPPVPKVASADV